MMDEETLTKQKAVSVIRQAECFDKQSSELRSASRTENVDSVQGNSYTKKGNAKKPWKSSRVFMSGQIADMMRAFRMCQRNRIGTDLFHWYNSEYLIAVDYHSRFFEVAKLQRTDSESIIEHLKSFFACHGTPEVVMSDNGLFSGRCSSMYTVCLSGIHLQSTMSVTTFTLTTLNCMLSAHRPIIRTH